MHFVELTKSISDVETRPKPSKVIDFNFDIESLTDKYDNAAFLDLTGAFCVADTCVISEKGSLFTYDGGHFTPEGALKAADYLKRNNQNILAFGGQK